MNNSSSEYIVSFEFPKIFQAIDKFLMPKNRGFELVYSGGVPNSLPSILYQSHQCKMRIECKRDRPYEDIEIYISYGRLHAPIDKDLIEWHNEKCYCWHSLEFSPLLHFLDGLSPVEARETFVSRIANDFAILSKGKDWSAPEYWSRRLAFTWEHYNQQLFDIFDIRYPEKWEEYKSFFKEYERLKDEESKRLGHKVISLFDPPRYKIC